MSKPLFEDLLRQTELKWEKSESNFIMDVVFKVVNFIDKVPDVDAFLLEDPTLSIEDKDSDINYPHELTIKNIVITNLQERLAAHFE